MNLTNYPQNFSSNELNSLAKQVFGVVPPL